LIISYYYNKSEKIVENSNSFISSSLKMISVSLNKLYSKENTKMAHLSTIKIYSPKNAIIVITMVNFKFNSVNNN